MLVPALPPFLSFFIVDSSSSSDSEKESLGEDVDDKEEEDEEEEKEEEEMGSDLEGMAPTPKRRRLANNIAFTASLKSGLYPESLAIHGPSQDLNPNDNSALDYLLLLWPASLCDLIADETDRLSKNVTGYAFSFNSLTMLSTMPMCSTSTVVMLTN